MPAATTIVADAQPAEATAEEARAFILSKLESVRRGDMTWSVTDPVLGDRWTWTEFDTGASDKNGVITAGGTTEKYAVSPSDLRIPVRAQSRDGTFQVKFECRVAKCISVSGDATFATGSIAQAEPITTRTEISDKRSSNYWNFRDEDAASRVAKAMNVLLARQGAQRSSF